MQTYLCKCGIEKNMSRGRVVQWLIFSYWLFLLEKKQNASTCTTWKEAWLRFKYSTLQLLPFRLSPSIHLAAASGKVFIVSISFRPKMTQVRSKNLSKCSWLYYALDYALLWHFNSHLRSLWLSQAKPVCQDLCEWAEFSRRQGS